MTLNKMIDMKKWIYLSMAATAMLFASCTSEKESNEEQTEAIEVVTETEAPVYAGVYEGTLPCADCPGIKTELTIAADGTYTKVEEYLEKQDGPVTESGTYNIVNNDVIELVTPSSGDKTYYKILDGAIALVPTAEGILNEGELAEHYKLAKKVL